MQYEFELSRVMQYELDLPAAPRAADEADPTSPSGEPTHGVPAPALRRAG